MYGILRIDFNHSFSSSSTQTHAPGDTFSERMPPSFQMQKNKEEKSRLGSLNGDLLCYMARKNRKEPKGHGEGSDNGYYLSTFDNDI